MKGMQPLGRNVVWIITMSLLLTPCHAPGQQPTALPVTAGVLDSIRAVYQDARSCVRTSSGCTDSTLLNRIQRAENALRIIDSLANAPGAAAAPAKENTLPRRLVTNLADLRTVLFPPPVQPWKGRTEDRVASSLQGFSESRDTLESELKDLPISQRVERRVLFGLRPPLKILAGSLDSLGKQAEQSQHFDRHFVAQIGYLILEREYEGLRAEALASTRSSCPFGPSIRQCLPTAPRIGWGASAYASNTVGASAMLRAGRTPWVMGGQVVVQLSEQVGGGGEVTFGREQGPFIWQVGAAYLSSGSDRWGGRWGPSASIIYAWSIPLALGITASTPQGVGIRAVYWVQPPPGGSPPR